MTAPRPSPIRHEVDPRDVPQAMRSRTETNDFHLFVDDDELRRRLSPKMAKNRFRSALRAIEDKHPDFPRIHALFRGRYWPAVRAWLDDENGVRDNGQSTSAQDGPETFNAPTQREARP